MEYQLIQRGEDGAVYAVREDGLAAGPLRDADFREIDQPDAAIRVDWASHLNYVTQRPDLWNNDENVLLASDRDPLSAVTDQPQSLEEKS